MSALKIGSWYRITVAADDDSPSLKTGDVVRCAENEAGCLHPEKDDDVWFADYEGAGNGFGTLVSNVEEVREPLK